MYPTNFTKKKVQGSSLFPNFFGLISNTYTEKEVHVYILRTDIWTIFLETAT